MTAENKPIKTEIVIMKANSGRSYWALPSGEGYLILTPHGQQILMMTVPYEILQQLYESIIVEKKEEV